MAEKGTRFDAMLAQAKKLVAVMEERQFGCFTWHEMVHDAMVDLDAIYFDKTFEADRPDAKMGVGTPS